MTTLQIVGFVALLIGCFMLAVWPVRTRRNGCDCETTLLVWFICDLLGDLLGGGDS